MKKKKNSKACGRKSRNEEAEAMQVEIQHSGCLITNLPRDILTAILFRLPIKEIIFCKCTCKSLHATISDPELANLHYAQSEVLPIARIVSTHVSRILYPLDQLEQDESSMNRFSSHGLQCNDYSELMKFDSKLKIPLRNFPLVLRDSINGNKDMMATLKAKDDHNYKAANSCNRFLCLSEPYPNNTPVAACNEDMMMITLETTKDQNYKVVNSCNRFLNGLSEPFRNKPIVVCYEDMITLNATDHNYVIVNSCNGFLCLSEPSCNNPVVVCNPVTGEFINLPPFVKGKNVGGRFDCGFGFSPMTNQYKVVIKMYGSRLAQVHILGTGSWKSIEFGPYSGYTLEFPTYLNGVVHWFCLGDMKYLSLMISFDCEKECFLPFSLPPLTDSSNIQNVGIGVLGGCLCLCDSSNQSVVRVWVIKNCGVDEKSWTQVFEIDMSCSDRPLSGSYQPIKYMKNGAVLMFNYHESVLICYDPRKPELKLFEFRPIIGSNKYEIVAHTPSFTSFKDVLAGCNVQILNVYSRCGGLKINGEAGAVYLYGKKINL